MSQQLVLKDFMSFDEMAEACVTQYPYYVPNKTRVGKFAKDNGYVVKKQKINYKQVYFYVKEDITRDEAVNVPKQTSNKIFTTATSIHFRCSFELFGSMQLGIVFQYFLDEHRFRVQNKESLRIPFSTRSIQYKTAVNKNTVLKVIDELSNLGLIRVSGGHCFVNAGYFARVATMYDSATKENKERIQQAFMSGNRNKLGALGLSTIVLDEYICQLLNIQSWK